MNAQQSRTNAVGRTAFADIPAVTPAVISPIPFPAHAVRKRVVIERPQPAPVLRICPYCDATFEDYTQRHNTTYCRPSCKSGMYRLKRRTAIAQLARLTHAPEHVAADVADGHGLPALEKLLTDFGYHFEDKQWCK